jgi:hypothetical protein
VHTAKLCLIENMLMRRLCNGFLCEDPLYNRYPASGPKMNLSDQGKMIPVVTCCAQIVTENSSVSGMSGPYTRQLYLPISTPSPKQIEKCALDSCYKNNVLHNFATVLGSTGNLRVSMNVGSYIPGHVEDTRNTDVLTTLHIDKNAQIEALGSVESCEDLLFGKWRTSCSPDFAVGVENGKTYALSVHKYQQYRNVRIGKNLTLMPIFGRKNPMVISMRCPELSASHTVVSASAVRSHSNFGPNNALRIVEIMAQLAPFVKHCCEVSMALTPATVADVNENCGMPTVKSTSIEHCFTHNADQGVSGYVGTHTFSVDTESLNTLTGSRTSNFPTITQLTVHIAVLAGSVPKCLKNVP